MYFTSYPSDNVVIWKLHLQITYEYSSAVEYTTAQSSPSLWLFSAFLVWVMLFTCYSIGVFKGLQVPPIHLGRICLHASRHRCALQHGRRCTIELAYLMPAPNSFTSLLTLSSMFHSMNLHVHQSILKPLCFTLASSQLSFSEACSSVRVIGISIWHYLWYCFLKIKTRHPLRE